MDITFECSQCSVSLHAPAEAAGHRMRCPSCKEVSRVPDLDTLLGDSIAGMLLEEVENELDQRHQGAESAITKAAEAKAKAQAERDKAAEFERQRLAAKAKVSDIEIIQTEPPRRSHVSETPKLKFPTKLSNDKARPYLIVTNVDERGVHFAFDSRWLKHERFRMSMPRVCAQTGEDDDTKLVARPVIFEQHLSPLGPGAGELHNQHEVKRVHQKTDRRVLIRMGPIEDATSPFDHSLVSYVAANRQGGLRGFTHQRPGGGLTCEVTVSNSQAAITWLTRVNGACGPEHELLENMLGGHESMPATTSSSSGKDPLAALDAHDRKALMKWCHLHGGEKLLAFFSDSETEDAPGEAGLAVTNKRLIFKKYHRHGDAELKDPENTLICRPNGEHIHLVLVTSNTRHKLISLKQSSFDRFHRFLRKHSEIKVQEPGVEKPVKQDA